MRAEKPTRRGKLSSNWEAAEAGPSTKLKSVCTGIEEEYIRLMEHFGPKLMFAKFTANSSRYSVAQWCIRTTIDALVKQEKEGKF
jgi:hypothetical protein